MKVDVHGVDLGEQPKASVVVPDKRRPVVAFRERIQPGHVQSTSAAYQSDLQISLSASPHRFNSIVVLGLLGNFCGRACMTQIVEDGQYLRTLPVVETENGEHCVIEDRGVVIRIVNELLVRLHEYLPFVLFKLFGSENRHLLDGSRIDVKGTAAVELGLHAQGKFSRRAVENCEVYTDVDGVEVCSGWSNLNEKLAGNELCLVPHDAEGAVNETGQQDLSEAALVH